MAFGKITKQDLVDAGLNPDLLQTLQDQGVKKTDLDTLRTELATSMTDLIKAQFAELETKLKPVSVVKETTSENKDEQPTDYDNFTTDPVAFVKNQTNRVAAGAAVEIMKTRRQIAYDNAVANLKGFRNSTLRGEIDKELEKYPAEKLAQFGSDPAVLIQQVHDMVMGRHHDDIVQDINKKDGKFNLVHSGSGGSGSVINDTSSKDTTRVFSDKEKQAMQRFGMTEEEWIAEEKAMEKEEETRHLKVGA